MYRKGRFSWDLKYQNVVATSEWVLENSLGAENRNRNVSNVTVKMLCI